MAEQGEWAGDVVSKLVLVGERKFLAGTRFGVCFVKDLKTGASCVELTSYTGAFNEDGTIDSASTTAGYKIALDIARYKELRDNTELIPVFKVVKNK